ncbi:FusB/FusC family EF-G-binding protein [Tumebacillus permanentifrigoris]|uniref:Treble-clef zinc-finger protein n=1 Tax=Tumebacillus permanentifrigoris TaxID=378543 RepID=A0A316D9J8_9BACL|nr:FusB/FusC family EF-G-binding protein [Tumebacillus permanentifrigoris]PWK13018.1 treble-clef zinc-finger protein [Tumebacillus permanentifrigoris]
MEAFLHPYQVNYIRSKINLLIGAFYFAGDYRVVDASRENVIQSLYDLLPGLTPEQRALIDDAANVRDKDELKLYMERLQPYIIPFPAITAAEIRKLFPKVKKLVLPDLANLDFSKITYLGWRDIATHALYIVYPLHGKWIGVECQYVTGAKKVSAMCTWCNRGYGGDGVALVTKQIKNRQIVDGYTVVGNHICLNSPACNQGITSTEELEHFLLRVK